VGGKRLCLFSKIADSWDFAKTREYVVPTSETNTARSSISHLTPSQTSSDKHQLNSEQMMWKVAVSPKEEHVLVLTSKQQIYTVSDITKDQSAESRVNFICFCNFIFLSVFKEPFLLELIFNSNHQSSIRGLDIAVQKPLFISTGDDHTVRLWNYETHTIEQMKVYNEPVYAISIHPNGHQFVIALASKVSLMSILIDGFATIKDYPIHAAHEVKFRYIQNLK
jgi:WD40 repeat protein